MRPTLGVAILAIALLATACSNDPTTSDEYVEPEGQLATVTAERDAFLTESQADAGRYEKAKATQESLTAIIQDPAAFDSELEVLDMLDDHATPDVMSGDMSWGDNLGPWWREGWDNTLFNESEATIHTWRAWLSDDGKTGGSVWTWAGTAATGKPFEIQGVEVSRFNDDGLYEEMIMFYPYEDAEVRRRFAEGN